MSNSSRANNRDKHLGLANAEAVIECIYALTDACNKMGIKVSAISLKTSLHRNALEREAKTLAQVGNPLAEQVVDYSTDGKMRIAGVRLEVHW